MLARIGPPVDHAVAAETLAALGFGAQETDVYLIEHPTDAVGQALTDRMFRIPARQTAEARREASAPTYLYDFRWRSPAADGLIGAGHCVDVPFAFNALNADGVEATLGPHAPQALADEIHGAWVSFVSSGHPGWPAYGEDRAIKAFGESS